MAKAEKNPPLKKAKGIGLEVERVSAGRAPFRNWTQINFKKMHILVSQGSLLSWLWPAVQTSAFGAEVLCGVFFW